MRPASTQGPTIRSTGLGGCWPDWMRPAVLAAAVVVVGGLGCGDDSTGPPAPPPPPPPPPPVATTVAVSPVTAELASIGETVQLSAEVRDQHDRPMPGASVSWTSSDAAVVSVNASGLATAAGNGTATVTATSGSASGTAAVTVIQSVDSVAVSPAADTIAPRDTLRLAAEAYDSSRHRIDGAEFGWSSSDAGVASVDESGLVLGVAAGSATITAAAGDARGTAEIAVANPDRAALVSLYNATGGRNWKSSQNWLTDGPLGQWHGVHIDRSGRVRVLNLPDNRLTGVIPPGLGNLTALEHLDLSRNGLAGPIPPELGNLNRLTNLLLFGNALTGQIPVELANLTSLRTLSLGDNQLTGSIPPTLGNLSDLRALLLTDNHLTGPIPPELADLENLISLQLFNNGLTGVIPGTLGNLGGLTSLMLYGNRLSGEIPPELGNLSSLEWLWLHHNQLTGPIPPKLGSMGSLRKLLLLGNQLKGPIPPEMGNLSVLEDLMLSDNRLSGRVPEELGNLTTLKFLRLSGNRDLFGPLPRSLVNLGQLRDLPFDGTDICAPADQVFQEWLEGLNWSGEVCDDTELDHRELLMALHASAGGANWTADANWGSDRPLDEWHGVTADTASRVMELDLSANGLAGTLSPEIGGLATLERLRLEDNAGLGGELPLTVVRLLALDELDIAGTGLCLPPSVRVLDWLVGVDRFRGEHCADDHGNSRETAAEALANGMVSGELDYAGDEDVFGVRIPVEGTLALRAGGDAETWLELHDGEGVPWGDGSGRGRGIARRIPPAVYFIRVAGVTPTTTGAYALELSFEPLAPPARAYLTQAVQSHDGAVPLMAGEDALLRVFVTALEGSNATMPPVRATFHSGGAIASVVDIPAGSSPIPAEVREDDLAMTANAVIPGSVLAPGLEMVVEIDSEGTLDPALGIGGRIPEEGRLALDVRRMPDFHVTAVPLLHAQNPDSSGFKATVGLTAEHEVFYETRNWLPVANMEVAVREPLLVDYDPREDMRRALEDIRLLQVADGASAYYMGVPPWTESGILGIAHFYAKSSVSRFDGATVAHEFGHNFSLAHAPCGNPSGVDSRFPDRHGLIGGWGYDMLRGSLVDPAFHTDLMTYCRARDWISDYSFTRAADYRTETGASLAMASRTNTAADRVLIVRGGGHAGRLRLDPAFVLSAPPTLPNVAGPYRLSGMDALGRELFSYGFAMAEVADAEEDAASFVFAIPAPDAWAGALDRITLTGPEGTVVLGREGATPERLVLDADSGRIRAILRGERTPTNIAADGLADGPTRTLLSRGIPGAEAWRR